MIHGLIEADVTRPRERLREVKERTGESLSFTGFIIYCCARAVDVDKHIQAYRDWRNRLIIFDDVDVFTPIERSVEGRDIVIPIVICLTLSFDHEIADGTPAARFVQRFKEFVESGSGLFQQEQAQPLASDRPIRAV